MSAARDWDASTYERVSGPLAVMGREVLDRLVLEGDETVLDAGCGTGKVTRLLHERLPRGRVIAVDAAPSMVEQARALLPATVDVRAADLTTLDLGEPMDAILSTATFHWITDHDALFARLIAALRPGGRLVAQCGGRGNVAAVKDAGLAVAGEPPFAAHVGGWQGDWNYAGAEETERRLRAAGFTEVWCWLSRVDVDPGDPHAYLRSICLGSFLERLPAELHEAFVRAALERLPDPLVLHYVRLNMLARRPGRPGAAQRPLRARAVAPAF
jgi:trans-aconitate 2-methyltransferase